MVRNTLDDDDDRHETLRDILIARRSSVASELRAIQAHAEPVEKAHRWAENLLCLYYEGPNSLSFRKAYNYALEDRFVAVSWTRKPSAREDPRWGRYRLRNAVSRTNVLRIRDCVLDRVVKYLEAYDLHTLWIDKVCINQHDSRKKAEAINSMDLVYKRCTKSVGLLSNPIYTSKGARLLGELLDGNLAIGYGCGNFCFGHGISNDTIRIVIRILEDLIGDDWWDRAWIYQEEYLSGLRMNLLIPVNIGVRVPSPYARVSGEFCVQATNFREKASTFLLAYLASGWQQYDEICSSMLRVVDKYNITLKRSEGVSRPMSSRILADIQQRSVEDAWDTLAITANACAYQTRLNAAALVGEGQSLSCSLIAQFLLNGEIFTSGTGHDGVYRSLLQCNVHEFLDQIQPEFGDLPTSTRELTFLKGCRLPSIKFCEQGLATTGCIWDLPEHATIDTSGFSLPGLSESRRRYLEDHPWQSLELRSLVEELEMRKEAPLASKLRTYLDRPRTNPSSPALEYMDLMASKLFQAIDQGFRLRLGYLRQRDASGIFTPPECELNRPMHAMTTWKPPRRGTDEVWNAVSLEVDVDGYCSVSPRRWMNGLVFFSKQDVEEAVFISWPASWTV